MDKIQLEHYVWGMLKTRDGKHVAGNEKVIFKSGDVSDGLVLSARKSIRTGLEPRILAGHDAYAFSPLGESNYVACHYHVSSFQEPIPRGNHLFVHYIFLQEAIIERLDWDLLPIFELFEFVEPPVEILEVPPLELDLARVGPMAQWREVLLKNISVTRLAINQLVKTESVQITSGPKNDLVRLYWLCGIQQCLPLSHRRSLSFATLVNPYRSSVRIAFTSSNGGTNLVIDWQSPGAINGAGSSYSTWIAEVLTNAGLSPKRIQELIYSLRLPEEHKGAPDADDLDLAIEFGEWIQGVKNVPRDKAQLAQLAEDIQKYGRIFDEKEVIDFLGMLIIQAVFLSEFDLCGQTLEQQIYLFKNDVTTQNLIERIIVLVLNEHLDLLAQFILRLDSLASKHSCECLKKFSELVVLASIEKNSKSGIVLWKTLIDNKWNMNSDWYVRAIDSFGEIRCESFYDFVNILYEICDYKTFSGFKKLFERSEELKIQYPRTFEFLDLFADSNSSLLLDCLSKSYNEIGNVKWFIVSTRVVLKSFSNLSVPCRDYISACADIMEKNKQMPDLIEELCELLVSNSQLLFFMGKNSLDLEDLNALARLFEITTNLGKSRIAALCFVSIVDLLMQFKKSVKETLNHYKQRIFLLDMSDFVKQMSEKWPEIEEMSLPDARSWIEFLQEALRGQHLSAGAMFELSRRYLDALEIFAAKSRHQEIKDLRMVIDASGDMISLNISQILLRLLSVIVVAGDYEAWDLLVQNLSGSQKIIEEYRKIVYSVLWDLSITEFNFHKYLNLRSELYKRNREWESAILTFALIQFPRADALVNLAIPFALTLQSLYKGIITPEELGQWIDVEVWLMETTALQTFCKELVVQDRNLAKETLSFCLSLSKGGLFGQIREYQYQEMSSKSKEEHFVRLVASQLRKQLTAKKYV